MEIARMGLTPVRSKSPSLLRQIVQGQIQLHDIDARLAKNAECAMVAIRGDKSSHFVVGNVARPCDSRDLILGGSRADLRVESACRGCHKVGRDGAALIEMRGTNCLYAIANGIQQSRVRRTE